jgi:hypothetical protein
MLGLVADLDGMDSLLVSGLRPFRPPAREEANENLKTVKRIKSKNAPTHTPFIPPPAEAEARVDPTELSRFEGEGGAQAPDPPTPPPKRKRLPAGRDEK